MFNRLWLVGSGDSLCTVDAGTTQPPSVLGTTTFATPPIPLSTVACESDVTSADLLSQIRHIEAAIEFERVEPPTRHAAASSLGI